MADKSHIEWTDATWNPITGCSVLSPGCINCYAMKLAGTRLRHHPSREGLTVDSKAGPVWNGQVRFNEGWLEQPLGWARSRMIFVCAHGDLFHESVPDEWIDRVFAIMALTPRHTYQVLTKRAKRMREYFNGPSGVTSPTGFRCPRINHILNVANSIGRGYHPTAFQDLVDIVIAGGIKNFLPNVWLGVSAERQPEWDERTEHLKATPAAIRFVSAEPLLGPIDGREQLYERDGCANCGDGQPTGRCCDEPLRTREPGLDWVIVGGESGADARPMHPDWARSLRDQCANAGVPFFFKQWGAWAPRKEFPKIIKASCSTAWPDGSVGAGCATDNGGPGQSLDRMTKSIAGRLLDGVEHNGMPA